MERELILQQNLIFQKLEEDAPIPYDLLLLADPSTTVIDAYLKKSAVYIATLHGEVVGVIVLLTISRGVVEIKNVAVKPAFQKQGIGSFLLESAIRVASLARQRSICIGTANSSIGQLYLYQKLGFEISKLKRNFFALNYTEPIYENGIQAKHLIVLTKQLNNEQDDQQE